MADPDAFSPAGPAHTCWPRQHGNAAGDPLNPWRPWVWFLLLTVNFSALAYSASCPVTRAPEHKFAISPQIYLNYSVAGDGPEAVVALHGFGASLDTWDEIAPELASRYRVYLVDMLGFGLSARPKGFRYTFREQAEVVASFVEFVATESGGRPIVLLGHSFGGSVAIAAYRVLRERNVPFVNQLILIDALGFPKQVHFPLYINILRVPVANRIVLGLLSTQFRARYVLRRVFFDRRLVTPERVCRYAQFYNLRGSSRALIDTAKQLGNAAEIDWLSKAISGVDVPTLIVWGRNDRLIPGDPQASLFHQAIRHSTEPKLLETGHVPHEERPSEAAALIEAFVK